MFDFWQILAALSLMEDKPLLEPEKAIFHFKMWIPCNKSREGNAT